MVAAAMLSVVRVNLKSRGHEIYCMKHESVISYILKFR